MLEKQRNQSIVMNIDNRCPKCCGEGKIHAMCLSPDNFQSRFNISTYSAIDLGLMTAITDCDYCAGSGIINKIPSFEGSKAL